jgi:hypoxanthine-guanine phosphoribosyltransferase
MTAIVTSSATFILFDHEEINQSIADRFEKVTKKYPKKQPSFVMVLYSPMGKSTKAATKLQIHW